MAELNAEICVGDKITIEGIEFTVESIQWVRKGCWVIKGSLDPSHPLSGTSYDKADYVICSKGE